MRMLTATLLSLLFVTVTTLAGPDTHDGTSAGELSPAGGGASDALVTYLGGTGVDAPSFVRTDSAGSTIVSGMTYSPSFPSVGRLPYLVEGDHGVFLAKFDASSTCVFATALAPRKGITLSDCELDAAGNIYLAGSTRSRDLPVKNAFQSRAKGSEDIWIAKVSSDGDLVYMTYLGSKAGDGYFSFRVDPDGNAYVAGHIDGAGYPTKNAFRKKLSGGEDLFLTKLDPTGTAVYSTYFGSKSQYLNGTETLFAFEIGTDGSAYLCGTMNGGKFPILNAIQPGLGGNGDVFLARFAADGTLIYSTPFGGVFTESPYGLEVDAAGFATLIVRTNSPDLPLVNPFQIEFDGDALGIARFAPSGSAVYSTYFGGGAIAGFNGSRATTALAPDGSLLLAGGIGYDTLPVRNAVQPERAGDRDFFVSRLDTSGQLVFSTYFGSPGHEDYCKLVGIDGSGILFAGESLAPGFPAVSALQPALGGGKDLFAFKLDLDGRVVFSTYFGGPAHERLAAAESDGSGGLIIVGQGGSEGIPLANSYQAQSRNPSNFFVGRLSATGELVYSTYVGGTREHQEGRTVLSVGGNSTAVLSFITNSADMAQVNPLQTALGGEFDAAVASFDGAGHALMIGFVGGSQGESQPLCAVDSGGAITVVTSTNSSDLQGVHAFQSVFGGESDCAVARFPRR